MKFEYTEVFNFEGAFRGMRNPKESWSKSDSKMKTFFTSLLIMALAVIMLFPKKRKK